MSIKAYYSVVKLLYTLIHCSLPCAQHLIILCFRVPIFLCPCVLRLEICYLFSELPILLKANTDFEIS